MFRVSWRSLGTARTEMTGMAGVGASHGGVVVGPAARPVQSHWFEAYLESQVQLLERAPYLGDECVHALTLLEAHQDVRGPLSCLRDLRVDGVATFSSRVCEAPSPITASGDCSSSRVWKRLSDVTRSRSFSREPSQRATRWMFYRGRRTRQNQEQGSDGADLQYNPVALLGSHLHGNLSHSFLALAQGHVVKLPKVDTVCLVVSSFSTSTLSPRKLLSAADSRDSSSSSSSFSSILNMFCCVVRPLLVHHLGQQLVLQTIPGHSEVDERGLGLNLWLVVRIGQFGVEDQSEAWVEETLLVPNLYTTVGQRDRGRKCKAQAERN
ncbi:hypothetical protein EYF80_011692 [Liparis tanakae]|uniref:Uncharacterized protein n=1 Tax=Liparis tanakae TaxID=230148 RepID=A0A4Z2IK68_9TELE|nr:hypothetical protein EYF80_011692 [Liparis tanakae]